MAEPPEFRDFNASDSEKDSINLDDLSDGELNAIAEALNLEVSESASPFISQQAVDMALLDDELSILSDPRISIIEPSAENVKAVAVHEEESKVDNNKIITGSHSGISSVTKQQNLMSKFTKLS